MALSDKWTRSQLRAVVRRELLDPNSRWWGDAELNGYLQAWQDAVQNELELVWGTATVTSSAGTLTLTDVASDIGRLDAVYWNNRRLVGRSKQELDILDRNWRLATGAVPYVCYQDSELTCGLYPAPTTAGTLVFEYPKVLTLARDTDTMQLPAWTKYSAKNYGCYKSYLRFGPNQDLQKALRLKTKFRQQLRGFRSVQTQYFPDKYITLRPGGKYEKDILFPEPPAGGDVVLGTVVVSSGYDEIPGGTVNGVNDEFTLTYSPSPTISLKVYLDGVCLTQDVHYTLSGSTITFEAAFVPQTGQNLFATYRYAS